MTSLKQMYDEGDAVIMAGIGTLVEYITKEEYNKNRKRKPRGLFAHNVQTQQTESLHPTQTSAKGVLGRLLTGLAAGTSINTASYSVAGSRKSLEGGPPPEMLHSTQGVVRYRRHSSLMGAVTNLTSRVSKSVFAETYNERLLSSIKQAEILGESMGNQTLQTSFDAEKFSQQLQQVAL